MLDDAQKSMLEVIEEMVDVKIDEANKSAIRTTIPGFITAFNQVNQLATVQVGVQSLKVSGETVNPPPIVQCPVCIYGASGGLVEVEIQPGDECLIHFSMRCIDGWRIQGGIAPLVSVERYRMSDAFVMLAPRSLPNVIEGFSNDGIKVRSVDGTKYTWWKSSGEIESNNGNGNMTLLASGDADINGCTINTSGNVITASGTDLDQLRDTYNSHNHPGDSGGSTGSPNQTV